MPYHAATRAVSRLLPVALLGFLVNDSGAITAALMLSYGVIVAGSEAPGADVGTVNI